MNMKKMMISILILYLGCSYGQQIGKCLSKFAEVESALLNDFENQYQIAKAYFPLKREMNPVCVTSYYYIGINKSDEAKQSCSNITISDGMFSGCSKWKWCTNTFYMAFDLAQLEAFSFHILLDVTSEAELEVPPICNISQSVLYEYFHRTTVLVSQLFFVICIL